MKSAIIDEAIAKEIDDAIAKEGQDSSQYFIEPHKTPDSCLVMKWLSRGDSI
jgi:hypothetical protein